MNNEIPCNNCITLGICRPSILLHRDESVITIAESKCDILKTYVISGHNGRHGYYYREKRVRLVIEFMEQWK